MTTPCSLLHILYIQGLEIVLPAEPWFDSAHLRCKETQVLNFKDEFLPMLSSPLCVSLLFERGWYEFSSAAKDEPLNVCAACIGP